MTYHSILIFHIGAGLLALLTGAAALLFRKGSRRHRATGNGFVIAMLCMSASGAYIAFMKSIDLSVLSGILTFYLVATAWMTIKRKTEETGMFEIIAFLTVLAVSVSYIIFGLEVANSETGLKDGLPATPYYIFGAVAALAAALDLRLIIRGGISGAPRIARHLWRMCFALFMATASFFLGQAQVFPEIVRASNILFVPVIIVIILMIYWLIRVSFTKWYKNASAVLH